MVVSHLFDTDVALVVGLHTVGQVVSGVWRSGEIPHP